MEKQTQMFTLVKEWQTSGISMKQFAQIKDVNYKSFAYWCSKFKFTDKTLDANQVNSQPTANPTFVEIINKSACASTINKPVQIELELASGLRIKIY